jgi:hypothetical protein
MYDYSESAARPASTTLIGGQYLARNRLSLVERAFLAADLRSGAAVLAEPTLQQAAALARVSLSSAGWAARRREKRWMIEAGFTPLVPAAPARATIATTTAVALAPTYANDNEPGIRLADCIGIGDNELRHIARLVGPDRMLAAARAVS